MCWFKEQGYEVHYASAGEEEVKDCDKHITVPFARNPLKPSNFRAFLALRRLLEQERYDLIHTHTPMGSVVTRLAATRSRKKDGTHVIYTAHGFHFFKGAGYLNWIIYYPIEKLMARRTDKLITINKEDYILAKEKFKTDVYYISGVGIDSKRFDITVSAKDKASLRASLDLKSGDFVILYLAELSKRKNQLWLINALNDLIKQDSKVHLLLAGQDSLNGECQKLVELLGLKDNIHFLGYRNDTPQLLKISDMAISSATQEGLPVNVLEAMYSRLPIIVTNCRGNRDLIRDGFNGYIIEQGDSRSLVEKIISLKQNKDIAKKMAQRNHKASSVYMLDKIIAAHAAIYNESLTR